MAPSLRSAGAWGAAPSNAAFSGCPSTKPYPPGPSAPGSTPGHSQASLCGLALIGAVWTGILFRYGRVLCVENLTKCECQAKTQNVFWWGGADACVVGQFFVFHELSCESNFHFRMVSDSAKDTCWNFRICVTCIQRVVDSRYR